MREILFRGKSIFHGCWEFGDLITSLGKTYIGNTLGNHRDDWCEVIPETVGQFTGILDKNSNKIFEGDLYSVNMSIVKMYSPHYSQDKFIREVYYSDQQACFQIEHIDWLEEIEIIANIHDNPELIK